MSDGAVVIVRPAFACGRLRAFNRLLVAAARAGADAVELAIDALPPAPEDLRLRVLNARGDPVALPAPELGVLRDETERAQWSAALRDTMPTVAGAEAWLDRLLPRPGEDAVAAALRTWPELLPGLRVRRRRPEDGTPSDEPTGILWLGARQRQTLADLGADPAALARGEGEETARYRPELRGEMAAAIEELREAAVGPLHRLRRLAEEVDPGLLGAWSRMERSLRRGADDFAGAVERSQDNHAGIRRARWHALAQALRPAGLPQEDGLSLLAAIVQFGLRPEQWRSHLERLRGATSSAPGKAPAALFLDC